MARKGKSQDPERITVSTSATLISDANANWISRLIRNTDGSATIYLGNSNVTTSTGFPLAAGAAIDVAVISGPVYGIVSSSTAVAALWEVGGR